MSLRSRPPNKIGGALCSQPREICQYEESDKEEEDHVEEHSASASESEEEANEANDSNAPEQGAEPSGPNIEESDFEDDLPPAAAKRPKRVGTPGTSLQTTATNRLEISSESEDKRSKARGPAANVSSMIEAWSLLFTDEMLASISLHTNESIENCIEKLTNEARQVHKEFTIQTYHNETNLIEIKALIGLLYYAGIFKASTICVDSLWEPESISLFRAVMPRHRFVFLLGNLSFDDRETRARRKKNDNFAPIRELWYEFISNCRKYYSPHEHVTLDKQLLSYRGKCPFRVSMKNEPLKYGMKIVILNDTKTYYMLNAIPYVGKVNTEEGESVPSYYVRTLTEPIHGTKRNVTCDNRFMSVSLVDRMMKEPFELTMVGTIRKNELEMATNFKFAKQVGTTQFAFHDDKILVAYSPKKTKTTLFLSSFHKTPELDPVSGKPEIIMFYKSTKKATQTFDQLCQEYTTCRMTRRWPVRVFYGMLDQAGINATVLYSCNPGNTLSSRRECLRKLAIDLTKPLLEQRLTIPNMRTSLRLCIEGIIQTPEKKTHKFLASNKLERKKNCYMCPSKISRKTRYQCLGCMKPMCSEHTSKLCCVCAATE